MSHVTSSFINSNVYTGADSVACIQLWSLHEQCHQLSGWGVVSLLYLLACSLQYRYLNNMGADICVRAQPCMQGSNNAACLHGSCGLNAHSSSRPAQMAFAFFLNSGRMSTIATARPAVVLVP
jgi:hypothetical protein